MSEKEFMKYDVCHISRVELILMIFQVLCKKVIFNLEICCLITHCVNICNVNSSFPYMRFPGLLSILKKY